jgi:hypothetical protein
MTQVLDQTKQHGTTSMMLPLMLAIAAVGTQAAVAVAGSMRGLQTVATASAAASTIAAGADIVHMPHGQCVRQIFEMRCPTINRTGGSGGSSPRPPEARNFCNGYLVAHRRVYFRA